MTIDINKNSALIDSAASGYSGCGCGNRRYYTKAEIDEMLKDVLDPEQIKQILDEMFDEYIEGGELEQLIINSIAGLYTNEEIDDMLEELEARMKTWSGEQGYLKDITLTINGTPLHNNGSIVIEGGGGEPVDISGKLDTSAFTAYTSSTETWKNNMEDCCDDVNGMIDYLSGKIIDLEETIAGITGSTPDTGDTPTPDTGDTPSSEMLQTIYRVTSTNGTKILGKLARTNFDYFVFDGQTYQITDYITDSGDIYFPFPSTGEKQVGFHRKSKIIYDYAFYDTPLLRITLPNDTTSINSFAFNTTLLTGITIPNSVTKIGQEALEFSIRGSETRNVEIHFGSGLTSIGSYINPKSKGVQNIYFASTTPPAYTGSSRVFYKTYPTLNIYVPSASVQAYKAAPGFTDVANRIQGI